ncbi:MAG: 4Fe-4S dicluster domain-containing protein [Caldisericaceae bacterium]|nr:4Fe-4S dicluster domain-containing protein [Caldisericaceae bacterium]
MKTVLVRPERCIGCRHCEVACAIEHSQSKDLFGMLEEVPISKPRIHVEVGINFLTFPNRCRHCDPAPCMQVCPTDAIYRDEETGSVLVNYEKCIHCEACAWHARSESSGSKEFIRSNSREKSMQSVTDVSKGRRKEEYPLVWKRAKPERWSLVKQMN